MKDFLKAIVYAGLFAVPFLTLYVANDYFFPYITGKNFWFRIIIDIAFAAWVILALYEVKYRPRISGIVWSFGALLVIMFFANLFGEHPRSSFWSNFERMDGYVSLVHTFMYMLMLGSVLQTSKHWIYLLNTSLGVATLVAMQGIQQYLDPDGVSRIDSTLGNAAYMAIYMLFHIFIAFWLFIESNKPWQKVLYGALAAMFVFVLLETGTRGTALGLVVGISVMSAYIGLFGTQFKQYRKYAIGAFLLLVLAVGAFIVGRDSEVVQNNQNLSRIANISLADLEIRGIIWGMALQGAAEEPIIGHGQSNFNYVFNEKYDPRLYAQEQWFDRAHNIFMDWLVTGGILGLIAYLSIFFWCAWYLLVRPMIKEDNTFTVVERGVLLGILAGYFTHNIVVFDNIVSYIFFAIILGLINSRVGAVPMSLQKLKVDKLIIAQFAAPVMGVALIAAIYFFHLPGMNAAKDIIDAFQAQQNPEVQLEEFKEAISRDSFAHQEITEQLAQRSIGIIRNPEVPQEIKDQYASYAKEQLDRLRAEKPGDARVEVFVGSYYRAIGENDLAAEAFALAREYSPRKQAIIIQQAFVEVTRGKVTEAENLFREAFELDERNLEAREYYAAILLQVGKNEEAIALMDSDRAKDRFARSEYLFSVANQAGETGLLAELFQYRVDLAPDSRQQWQNDPQTWATLAYLYYQLEENDRAIETLRTGQEIIPSFEPTAQCFIGNIENGNDPQEGC